MPGEVPLALIFVGMVNQCMAEFVGKLVSVLRPEQVFGVQPDFDPVVFVLEMRDRIIFVSIDRESLPQESGVGAMLPQFLSNRLQKSGNVFNRCRAKFVFDVEHEFSAITCGRK